MLSKGRLRAAGCRRAGQGLRPQKAPTGIPAPPLPSRGRGQASQSLASLTWSVEGRLRHRVQSACPQPPSHSPSGRSGCKSDHEGFQQADRSRGVPCAGVVLAEEGPGLSGGLSRGSGAAGPAPQRDPAPSFSPAYQVTHRLNATTANTAAVEVLAPSARQYTATGLAPESVYLFRITAQTRKGWGEAAEALVVTTEKRGDHPLGLGSGGGGARILP